MKYTKNKQAIIKDITLSGFMFALFIVVKFAFKEINLINGYSPQIQLVVLVLGMYCIQHLSFRILFLILAFPFTIMFGASGDIVFDYLIPTYGFFPFIFLPNIINYLRRKYQSKRINQNLLCILIIFIFHCISYGILLASYTYSGIINYHASFEASITLNGPIAGISWAISLGIFYAVIESLYFLKEWYHFKYSKDELAMLKKALKKLTLTQKEKNLIIELYNDKEFELKEMDLKILQKLIQRNILIIQEKDHKYYYIFNPLLNYLKDA